MIRGWSRSANRFARRRALASPYARRHSGWPDMLVLRPAHSSDIGSQLPAEIVSFSWPEVSTKKHRGHHGVVRLLDLASRAATKR